MDILQYIEQWSAHPIGQAHVLLAMLALIIGPVIFLTRKGTLPHRVLGYVFSISMIVANAAALNRYTLTGGFNFFHFAALVSMGTLLPAIYFAWRARLKKSRGAWITHGILMSWAYFGLVMAFVSEAVTRQFPILLHGEDGWLTFFGFLMPFMAATAWWTNRMVRRHVVPGERPAKI